MKKTLAETAEVLRRLITASTDVRSGCRPGPSGNHRLLRRFYGANFECRMANVAGGNKLHSWRRAIALSHSILVGRVALQVGLMATAMLLATALAQAATITLNFDATPLGPGVEIDATAYLASFGITLSAVTPSASVLIIGQGLPETIVVAHSAPNYFNEFNGNHPETMTLNFPVPLTSLSFFRDGMTYDSKPQWTAEALNAQGTVLATVGESLTASGAPIPAQQFILTGAGITALRIDSDNHDFTALSGVMIDDLTLVTQTTTTPEPGTVFLFPLGLLVLQVARRRARRRAFSRGWL